jgi:hypothetical protein
MKKGLKVMKKRMKKLKVKKTRKVRGKKATKAKLKSKTGANDKAARVSSTAAGDSKVAKGASNKKQRSSTPANKSTQNSNEKSPEKPNPSPNNPLKALISATPLSGLGNGTSLTEKNKVTAADKKVLDDLERLVAQGDVAGADDEKLPVAFESRFRFKAMK